MLQYFLLNTGMEPGVSRHTDPPQDTPKNIILMIGDGMGLSQVAASIYDSREIHPLERFPVVGLQKTHSFNSLITDSAAGATAMACGVKTYNSAVGVNADTIPCQTLFEMAEKRGFSTGMVVTSSLIHATPAAFISHRKLRGLYEHIAIDIAESDVDCLIGGGMKYFTSRAADTRNLVDEMAARGYQVTDFRKYDIDDLDTLTKAPVIHFTGMYEPLPRMQGRNYLPEAVSFALKYLKHRASPFLLVVEGSQIDIAGHANDATYMKTELRDFQETIQQALNFVLDDRETLLIVTSDHATGGLTLGPGNPERDPKLSFTTNRHLHDMVPVFAIGPGAQRFGGIYDNTDIFARIRELASL